MRTLHSPGPWKVETWKTYSKPHGAPDRIELVVCNRENKIATLAPDLETENPYTINKHSALANARLFAAAPELLAACLSAIKAIEDPAADETTARKLLEQLKDATEKTCCYGFQVRGHYKSLAPELCNSRTYSDGMIFQDRERAQRYAREKMHRGATVTPIQNPTHYNEPEDWN